jgi:hypothetical protein
VERVLGSWSLRRGEHRDHFALFCPPTLYISQAGIPYNKSDLFFTEDAQNALNIVLHTDKTIEK